MNELALFAGAGGGILGGKLLGWRTVCAVECDAYAAQILAQRQNDRTLEPFPIWSDVRSFDGKPWQGLVDVVSGGFPCQDISAAGKGAGIDGERSGLWGEMARIICEVRPQYAFVENSPMLTSRGLGRVLGDLAEMGYDAKWCVLGADDVGAPHRRKRIWIVGNTNDNGQVAPEKRKSSNQRSKRASQGEKKTCKSERSGKQRPPVADTNRKWQLQSKRLQQKCRGRASDCCLWWDEDPADLADATGSGCEIGLPFGEDARHSTHGNGSENKTRDFSRNESFAKPFVGRVVDGVAYRNDRLKAIGNGQVPAVAATAWRILTKPKNENNRTRKTD